MSAKKVAAKRRFIIIDKYGDAIDELEGTETEALSRLKEYAQDNSESESFHLFVETHEAKVKTEVTVTPVV